ncbi:MAG: UDP-N-acetylmuramoyl-L-alanyl-D-glutamate--2,6-diaminopimelate ligase [Bacteroidales bacterium]|nr:UDP-N-acetylmuramoyl-L-alanyl-D-glutamate--2,6-diaminopimelate ligase [Bacteroidales bacterium]
MLQDILKGIDVLKIIGPVNVKISSVDFDSRQAAPNSVFVAVKGTQVDGHIFIDKAIGLGSRVIVCEQLPENHKEDVTYVQVKSTGKALGCLASDFFDNPSSKLTLIGVTGTNGKTTIVSLLFELFRKLGYKAGLLSTIENKIEDEVIGSTHTTPDPVQMNNLMNKMVETGCSFCFMEVSSHSIHQDRIAGLDFNGGIFTNLTHDHLDYHKTFDDYIKAKKKFFDELPFSAFALTNVDDKNGRIILQNTKAQKKTYGFKTISDFKGKIIENQFEGLQLNIEGKDFWCRLVGKFNAYNILAVYGAAILTGENKDDVLTALSSVDIVDGRFDYFRTGANITGIIDYAHTPDALKNVLNTINAIRTKNETLITVVGAGGDRDPKKREMMGKIAGKLSDRIILTSDNPRSEDPDTIIEDIKSGVEPNNSAKVISITNRREAIKTACVLANPGDIILVAGKGHEKYQEIKGVKYPFNDKEILKEFLMIKPTNN